MMPLTLTDVGQEQIVRRIGGNDEVRRHLENLGFPQDAAIGSVGLRLCAGTEAYAGQMTFCTVRALSVCIFC